MVRPITVGMNGSAESLAAAHWAAAEAQRRGLPLRLVYAWEWLPEHLAPAQDVGPRPSWPERILNDAANEVESRHPGLPVSVDQIEDLPAKALIEAARQSELLVLGSRGLGGIHGFLAGSVSLAVVARAERPVVLVRADGAAAESEEGEVVVGLDLGHPCGPVAEFAFAAAAVRKAPLRAIRAWRAPALYDYQSGGADAGSAETAEKQERQELSAALRPWRERYPHVAVRDDLLPGSPAQHLVEAASAAALLVVGRRTERPPMGTRLGAVAHSVLHHAPCPVAVVPHD